MLPLPPVSKEPGRFHAASLQRLCSLHAPGSEMDEPAPSLSRERPGLLLVEKDTAMCAMLTEMLSPHYQVEAVSDGLTACHAAKSHPPDLVIIDLYVPGTDNLTLIHSLRADPRTTMLPIVMLTASVNRELLLRCLTAGASNFLLKPFRMADLLTCVRLDLELRGPHAGPRKIVA